MYRKLPVDGFEWKKNTSKSMNIFKKKYNENNDKRYILEVDVEYSRNLYDSHNDRLFLLERRKI